MAMKSGHTALFQGLIVERNWTVYNKFGEYIKKKGWSGLRKQTIGTGPILLVIFPLTVGIEQNR
jgi:hypothetical protein